MNEHFKNHESSEPPQSETGVLELLKKIQQQLVFLERKIDALGSGAAPRPFRKERFMPRKPRSFDRPHHSGKGEHGQDAGPGYFQKPPFEKRHPGKDRPGFSHFKKPFFRHRKDRP